MKADLNNPVPDICETVTHDGTKWRVTSWHKLIKVGKPFRDTKKVKHLPKHVVKNTKLRNRIATDLATKVFLLQKSRRDTMGTEADKRADEEDDDKVMRDMGVFRIRATPPTDGVIWLGGKNDNQKWQPPGGIKSGKKSWRKS